MGVSPRQVRLHSALTQSAPRTKGPQPSGFLPGAPTSHHSQQLPSGRGQLPWEQRAGLLGTRVNRRLNGCLCLPSPTENLAEKCQIQHRGWRVAQVASDRPFSHPQPKDAEATPSNSRRTGLTLHRFPMYHHPSCFIPYCSHLKGLPCWVTPTCASVPSHTSSRKPSWPLQ